MNKMEKEFVPYELAVSLKALGFDEPCFGYYDTDGLQVSTHYWYPKNKNTSFPESQTTNNPKISAPTFSQAFRWFREKYGIMHRITSYDFGYQIHHDNTPHMDIKHIDRRFDSDVDYNTYEEAELACLDKLIKIVETEK